MAFFLLLSQKAAHYLDKRDEQRETGYLAFFLISIPANAAPVALISAVSEHGGSSSQAGGLSALLPVGPRAGS